MTKQTDTANNHVPKDYAELYQYYIVGDGNGNSLCYKLLRSMLKHGTPDEFETLAHDVFERILKTDQLAKFDPNKANFGGVIFYVTRSIVNNHLDKKGRNPLTGLHGGTLTEEVNEDEFEPGMYNLDRLFGTEDLDQGEDIDSDRLVERLLNWAKELFDAPRHKRDESLYPLIGLLAEGNTPKECGAELGVTPSTIHNWLLVLRQKVLEIQREMA